jgi:hypothetical protein
MNKIFRLIKICLFPAYWIVLGRFDKDLDLALLLLMSKHKFEYISEFRCKLGPAELWVGNYPYSAFIPTVNNLPVKIRPSRTTVMAAGIKFKAETGVFPGQDLKIDYLTKWGLGG